MPFLPQCNHRLLPSFLGPSRDDPNCLPRKKGEGEGCSKAKKRSMLGLAAFSAREGVFLVCVGRSAGRHRCRRAGKLEKGGFIILRDQSGVGVVDGVHCGREERGQKKEKRGNIFSLRPLVVYVHRSPYRLHRNIGLRHPCPHQGFI